MSSNRVSRRTFLRTALTATAATTATVVNIVPRHVVARSKKRTPPSETLNVAGIGAGGRAFHDLCEVARTENIVALCDVDEAQAGDAYRNWPQATRYKDYRVMLEKEKGIDAVIVATPDHSHAFAAMTAMQLGKPVYVEKPMAHSIYEVRKLAKAARKYNVATQMGNQGHSFMGCRVTKAWIEDGAIGDVTEVHCWTTHTMSIGGMNRPTDTPPVPATLDWDLWLGPAPERPYHPTYCPDLWRAWWDFGTCIMGDMGCHVIDAPYWILQLGTPTRVSAQTSGINNETGPKEAVVRYEFPPRDTMPALVLTWYDGGKMPERPPELEEGRIMGDIDGGCLFVGSKGKWMTGTYGDGGRLIPETRMAAYKHPKVTTPKSPGHYMEWINACKGGESAGANFDYAAGLTELVFLGVLAIRTGQPIEWDPIDMKAKGLPDAAPFIHSQYRKGWSL